jgi:Na+/melibiose symporter-like transporter
MIDGRWATFVGCLYAAIATGCGYTFSIFSGALKKAIDLSQADLDTINTASFCSGLVAFLPGMLNDRAGPKLSLIVGGMAQTGSYIAYWAVATRRIQTSAPVAMMSVLGATAMLGSSCITSAVFATLTRNFPKQRGEVIGIAKAWVGLTGGVLAQLYTGFVGKPDNSPGTLNVVLVQAFLVFVVTVPIAPMVKLHTLAQDNANNLRTRLRMAYATIALVVTTITVGAICESSLSQQGLRAFAIAMCVWWSIPMLIPLPCADDPEQRQRERRDKSGGTKEPLLQQDKPLKQQQQQQPTPEMGPLLMLQHLDCYLLFYISSCLIGGGIMITMNAAQMVEAAGLKKQVRTSPIPPSPHAPALTQPTRYHTVGICRGARLHLLCKPGPCQSACWCVF